MFKIEDGNLDVVSVDGYRLALRREAINYANNTEFVVPGKTGVIIKNCNAERLAEELINIAAAPEKWNSMRLSALKESEKYKPDIAARPLIDRING